MLAVSFIALGLHFKPLRLDWRPGPGGGDHDPAGAGDHLRRRCTTAGVGLHKISLGSLIIALGLLVDDAIIAVEMMVRKLEEGFDKARAATFAYEATAMPMLTGTLITAAGFLPIGLAKSTVGEYTFAIFAVTAAALLISWLRLGVLRALPRHRAAARARRPRGARAAARAVRHAVLRRAFARVVALVRRAPLEDDRRDGRVARRSASPAWARCSSSSSPTRAGSRSLVDLWYPEGTSFAANEAVTQARRGAHPRGSRASTTTHLGRQRRRALRPVARPDLSADQRRAR